MLALGNPVWIVVVASLLGWAITQTAYWRHIELRLFDLMVVNSAPNKVELPITLIGIDEATFSALGVNWPLPRHHHATLLDKLKQAGVAVVGFDISFPGNSTPQDDELFAAAIKRFGTVVLASGSSGATTPGCKRSSSRSITRQKASVSTGVRRRIASSSTCSGT